MVITLKKILLYGFLIVIAVAAIFASVSNKNSLVSEKETMANDQLSEKEKLEDFEYLYTILKDNYPFFEVNKRLYNIDWLSNKEVYIDKLKNTKDDSEFYQTLEEILGDLHNAHTVFVPVEFYNQLKEIFELDTTFSKPYLEVINDKKVVERYKKMQGEKKEYVNNSVVYNIVNENIRTEIIAQGKVGDCQDSCRIYFYLW
jgi:hypothetical protein